MLKFIGDSHVSVFGGVNYMSPTWPNYIDSGAASTSIRQDLVPGIVQYRMGPQTAYNFYKRVDLVNKMLETADKKKDIIFFSGGEIDIREHIIRIADLQNISVLDSVINTLNNYFKFLEQMHNLGWKIGVLRPHIAVWDFDDPKKVEAVHEFNTRAGIMCEEKGYYHIGAMNFIEPSADRGQFYFDGLHLSQQCMPYFIKQLKAIGIYG